MQLPERILTFQQVLDDLGTSRAHLLIGNGFSIACDPIFSYPSLYAAAMRSGLSERAQHVFARLGTNNFEGVMRLLDDAHWVARTYDLLPNDTSAMLDDMAVVKEALARAVAESHLDHTGLVSDDKKRHALEFLTRFHNVFCTNYDLLAYWVNMTGTPQPRLHDGFGEDEPESESVVFREHIGDHEGLYYLHGGLHLFVADGAVRKHCWSRSGRRLTDLIRDGLAEKKYPLFVAEGDPDKKLAQINTNAYLSYALGKLARVKGPLVVYGHALGPSDAHVLEVIGRNTKLRHLYVGLYGDPASVANMHTRAQAESIVVGRELGRRGRKEPLQLTFFASTTAPVWDASDEH